MTTKFLRQKILVLALFATAILPSPANAAQRSVLISARQVVQYGKQEQSKTEKFLRTELYFGMNKPGGEIGEEDFQTFVNEVITPEFPEGLTVLSGIGQFREANGKIVHEKSKVLILLYPPHKRKESSRKIERIRAVYKEKFQQQSVLRVDDAKPVQVSF